MKMKNNNYIQNTNSAMGFIKQEKLSFFVCNSFAYNEIGTTFAIPLAIPLVFLRALSSVGSEHLVYTEGVGGSNPSAPTKNP